MCDITHSYVQYDSFICVTWLIHMCDMTHSYVCAMPCSSTRHDSFMCVTWLIHMCDMTHSYMCATTYSPVRHGSIICVTWLIHVCDMTHSYWSALETFKFERAHVFCGVCNKRNINRQILETRFLYEHPLQIRQGVGSVLQVKDRLNARAFLIRWIASDSKEGVLILK